MAQGSSTGRSDIQCLPAAAAGSECQSSSAAGIPANGNCNMKQPDQADPSSQLSATDMEFIAETAGALQLISRVVTCHQTGHLKLGRRDWAILHSLNALLDPEAAFQSVFCRVQLRAQELAKSDKAQGAPSGLPCLAVSSASSLRQLSAQ